MLLAPVNGVSEDLRIQAATILGSFAHGKPNERKNRAPTVLSSYNASGGLNLTFGGRE